MVDTQTVENYITKCYSLDDMPSDGAEFIYNNIISTDFLRNYHIVDDSKLINKHFESLSGYLNSKYLFGGLKSKFISDYPKRFYLPSRNLRSIKVRLNSKALPSSFNSLEFNLIDGYIKVFTLRELDLKIKPDWVPLLDVKRSDCFVDSTIYFNEPRFQYRAYPGLKKIDIGPLTLYFDSIIDYNVFLAVLKCIDEIKKDKRPFINNNISITSANEDYLTQYMCYDDLSDGLIEDVYKRIIHDDKSEFSSEEWKLFSTLMRNFSYLFKTDSNGKITDISRKIASGFEIYSDAFKNVTFKNKNIEDTETFLLNFDFIDRNILIQSISNDIKYDFKDSLFSPVAQPDLGRISVGEIVFDFDNPFFYNVLLYALKKADENIDNENNTQNELKKTVTSTEKKKISVKKSANDSPTGKKDKADSKTDDKKLKGYFEELDKLVGLAELKSDVKKTVNLIKVQKIRKDKGLKTIPISKHLVFTGNPGTGKTTVARILANIYREIGILSKGQLIEVDRADLVGGYIGQTALKTQKKIEEALGGILFIDEAYSLYRVNDNDFGREAIDTLVKAMEDNRDDFVVIVAGYPEQMQQFIDVNPGLKSRFNKYLHFPDYSKEELIEIFNRICKQYEYKTLADAQNKVVEKIERLVAKKDKNFANAREIRNMFENIVTKQADRIASSSNENEDYSILTLEDCI